MGEHSSLPSRWQKAEVLGTVFGGLLIPVVILVAGHQLAEQQAHAADARRNSDRVAELLSHLASANPHERVLAIQALRYHHDTHELPEQIVASLVTVAATDSAEVGAAAVAALGSSMQPEIERNRLVLELLGPMMIHLDRTGGAFQVWQENNTILVTGIIRNGNSAVRRLLIEKAHLIPRDLVDDAAELLRHYDAWFIEYGRVQKKKDTPYVFVGPKGFPFPTASEQKFRERYAELVAESPARVELPQRHAAVR
jgi:hypothetical protein